MRWLPRTSISRTAPSAPAGAARAGWRWRDCAAAGSTASARQAVAISSSARLVVCKGGAVAVGVADGERRGP
jgi:hypothetical protein